MHLYVIFHILPFITCSVLHVCLFTLSFRSSSLNWIHPTVPKDYSEIVQKILAQLFISAHLHKSLYVKHYIRFQYFSSNSRLGILHISTKMSFSQFVKREKYYAGVCVLNLENTKMADKFFSFRAWRKAIWDYKILEIWRCCQFFTKYTSKENFAWKYLQNKGLCRKSCSYHFLFKLFRVYDWWCVCRFILFIPLPLFLMVFWLSSLGLTPLF